MVKPAFLDALSHSLKAGATWHFATDVQAYYQQALELLQAHADYTVQKTWDLASKPSASFTHFDAKAREKGSNVYFIQGEK